MYCEGEGDNPSLLDAHWITKADFEEAKQRVPKDFEVQITQKGFLKLYNEFLENESYFEEKRRLYEGFMQATAKKKKDR